ncbi:MAG: AMP-binding protein, partial [Alphaproteobacteria bacterium]|nr:AMP-binding protein [Alphaproteobacteria bacterium]
MNGNLYARFAARFPEDRSRHFVDVPGPGGTAGVHYTYGDLESISGRFARLIADLGAKPGDRLVAQTEKSPEALFLYLACLRAGVIYVPLNTAYRPAELEYFLGDAEPRVLVCDPGAEASLASIAAK